MLRHAYRRYESLRDAPVPAEVSQHFQLEHEQRGVKNNTPTKAKKTVALAFILFGISSLGIKAMQN